MMRPLREVTGRALGVLDRWLPRRAWRGAIGAALLALPVAAVVDRWYAGIRHRDAVAHVRSDMAPYADGLRGAVERRLGLLSGLRSFAESRGTRDQLDAEFSRFGQGALSGTKGVRALQFVEGGRIVMTYPIEGNEAVLMYNLRTDPRPPVSGDVLRALESGQVTVTGPIRLIQGGTGILIRQRIAAREGFPQLAAIILDVPTLLAEAGIPDPRSGLHLEVRNRAQEWFGGDPSGSAAAPETLVVSVVDGNWRLLGAPIGGWATLTGGPQGLVRTALALVVLAAAMAGFLLGGREDRLRAEAALKGTQLDLALRAGGMGGWEWDLKSGKVWWSEAAARIFGFRADEVADPVQTFFDLVHPDDLVLFRRRIEGAIRGDVDRYMVEYRLRQKDGSYRWLLSIGELERDEQGLPAKHFGVISDSTERRNLEEEVRHSQRIESVGKLAGGVAHDFNNLLTAITGFTELARMRVGDLPDGKEREAVLEDLDHVLMAAQRGSTLTGQLLAFSRRSPSAPKRVDLSRTVREMQPLLERLLAPRVQVRAELAADVRAIHADPGQLGQVVMNLAVNARDAMPDGGTVVVRTRNVVAAGADRPSDAPPGEWVQLEIEDTGVGMSDEVQSRMFDPYFTTKEAGRGTGLGLAVVSGAVESARGVVAVRSKLGRGTTFHVYYPPYRDSLPPSGAKS